VSKDKEHLTPHQLMTMIRIHKTAANLIRVWKFSACDAYAMAKRICKL